MKKRVGTVHNGSLHSYGLLQEGKKKVNCQPQKGMLLLGSSAKDVAGGWKHGWTKTNVSP